MKALYIKGITWLVYFLLTLFYRWGTKGLKGKKIMTEHRTKRHKYFIELVKMHHEGLLELVSLSTIYAWQKGAVPNVDIVDKVAKVLGCTRDDIVYWEARKRG